MKIKFLSVLLFTLLMISRAQGQIPTVACGSITRFACFASKFVDARTVDVWLPPHYNKLKKYAVLYMHDGQMLFDSTITWNKKEWGVDETLCRLTTSGQIKNCIVVAIWNNGAKRHPEYFPQKPFYTLSIDDQQRILNIGKDKNAPLIGDGPIADRYLKFLVYELKPFIDKHFSTLSNRANTFISGSSMGGLISMYAICEYPQIFGGAACISTHWTGIFTTENNPIPAAFLKYLKAHLPSPQNHRLYFDYGNKTLDSLYKPYQLQANAIMRKKGYTAKNWITREFPGEDHTETAWAKRFHIPALFLLRK